MGLDPTLHHLAVIRRLDLATLHLHLIDLSLGLSLGLARFGQGYLELADRIQRGQLLLVA